MIFEILDGIVELEVAARDGLRMRTDERPGVVVGAREATLFERFAEFFGG
jgi:hypothetical protein